MLCEFRKSVNVVVADQDISYSHLELSIVHSVWQSATPARRTLDIFVSKWAAQVTFIVDRPGTLLCRLVADLECGALELPRDP